MSAIAGQQLLEIAADRARELGSVRRADPGLDGPEQLLERRLDPVQEAGFRRPFRRGRQRVEQASRWSGAPSLR